MITKHGNPWMRVFLLICAGLFFSAGAQAYELKETEGAAAQILLRQKGRAELIGHFLASSLAGESASGYLEVRREPGTTKKMVEEENADRKKLYGLIAEQNRVGVGAVESGAAEKIRKSARKGTVIQLPSGRWEQK